MHEQAKATPQEEAGAIYASVIVEVANHLMKIYERREMTRWLGDGLHKRRHEVSHLLFHKHRHDKKIKEAFGRLSNTRAECCEGIFASALLRIQRIREGRLDLLVG